ncbi:hypothetical protein JTE87_04278 [Bacillus amyloliquefaciens]|nr:hypothetical protein [Bacillus subtilis]MCB5337274.1 hypothetical protein [Bacillus amyloliquefaciens]
MKKTVLTFLGVAVGVAVFASLVVGLLQPNIESNANSTNTKITKTFETIK